MSRTKRMLVHTLLAVFTVWPAVHIVLVQRYEVNAWKLAGWGMYAAPQLPLRVRVSCLTPDMIGVYELRSVPGEVEPVLEDFLRRRRGLGGLAEPQGLGEALLRHYTAIEGVEIVVLQAVLNRGSGVIEERATAYVYRRGGSRRAGRAEARPRGV